MYFSYLLFGLRVVSNRCLPGLEAITRGGQSSDMSVWLGVAPPQNISDSFANNSQLFYQSIYPAELGEPAFRTWKASDGSLLRIDYHDGTRFWIDLNGASIWTEWGENSSFDDAVSYLLGPVFGFVLRMRGVICLHASAVAVDGRAIAFVGVPGAGKSTTAAAMVKRGHALLADDIVALTESADGFLAVPAYPMLGLWPEAVEALYGTANAAPASSENDEKRRVSLSSGQFASQALPLGAIFILEERRAEPVLPRIEKIAPQQALISLVANTYANLPLEREMRALEFAFLGRLLASVPVRRVHASEDVSRINALCELIEGEAAVGQTAPRTSAGL